MVPGAGTRPGQASTPYVLRMQLDHHGSACATAPSRSVVNFISLMAVALLGTLVDGNLTGKIYHYGVDWSETQGHIEFLDFQALKN